MTQERLEHIKEELANWEHPSFSRETIQECLDELERLRCIVRNIHFNTEDYASLTREQALFKLRVVYDMTA